MTLTLNLSEEQENLLREVAARQQTSPENVVLSLVAQLADAENAAEHRARVQAAGDYVQRKNAELYKRLA